MEPRLAPSTMSIHPCTGQPGMGGRSWSGSCLGGAPGWRTRPVEGTLHYTRPVWRAMTRYKANSVWRVSLKSRDIDNFLPVLPSLSQLQNIWSWKNLTLKNSKFQVLMRFGLDKDIFLFLIFKLPVLVLYGFTNFQFEY